MLKVNCVMLALKNYFCHGQNAFSRAALGQPSRWMDLKPFPSIGVFFRTKYQSVRSPRTESAVRTKLFSLIIYQHYQWFLTFLQTSNFQLRK